MGSQKENTSGGVLIQLAKQMAFGRKAKLWFAYRA